MATATAEAGRPTVSSELLDYALSDIVSDPLVVRRLEQLAIISIADLLARRKAFLHEHLKAKQVDHLLQSVTNAGIPVPGYLVEVDVGDGMQVKLSFNEDLGFGRTPDYFLFHPVSWPGRPLRVKPVIKVSPN